VPNSVTVWDAATVAADRNLHYSASVDMNAASQDADAAGWAVRPYVDEPSQAVLIIDVNVGAGSECVIVIVEVSPDAVTWYPTNVLDMSQTQWDSVTCVTYTADEARARALLPFWAPYLRVGAYNNGTNACTITCRALLR